MKKILIISDTYMNNHSKYKGILTCLNNFWDNNQVHVVSCVVDNRNESTKIVQMIHDENPDYVCSIDMLGFDLDTLTETFYYNICTAKQMHIVVDIDQWLKYDKGEFALNIYLFLPGEAVNWMEKYPHILNILGYHEFDDTANIKKTIEGISGYFLKDIL